MTTAFDLKSTLNLPKTDFPMKANLPESEPKRLAAWAAIFGAVTALAGIWGMNFEFMPELKQPWGYPAALGLMLATAGALAWRFRRAGWL